MDKKIFLAVFSLLALMGLSSCTSKEKKEIEARNAFLAENNITVEPTSTGLYYIETVSGTGINPTRTNSVVVHYEGRFLDGQKFDSSYDRGTPFEFIIGTGQVIAGWDEGIAYMKAGGKATLIIPSQLAYGSKDFYSIPAYSTLVFEVELIEIKQNNL